MAEPQTIPSGIASPYLTAKEAAIYLRLSYGTFRQKARSIRKCHTGRYHVADLDAYAASSPKRAARVVR